MIQLLGVLAPVIGKALDKVFPDTEKRELAKIEIMKQLESSASEIAQAAASIIKTEAASSHWLAANWRPLTMLTFVGLIVARWMGWAAPGMTEAEYIAVYDMMKIGLGGYVVGRSVEKIAPGLLTNLFKENDK